MKNHRLLSSLLLSISLAVHPLSASAADSGKPTAPASATKASTTNPDATSAASRETYHLRVNDTINMDVVDDPKANLVEYKIESDGTVRLKYLKEPVKLAGLTVDEAQELVVKTYKDNEIFVNPEISIQVRGFSDRKINVAGSVNAPHQVIIPPGEDATLVSVVTACGGPAPIGARTVTITRHLANGKTENFKADLKDAYNDGTKDIKLQDGDSVYLPQDIFGGVW